MFSSNQRITSLEILEFVCLILDKIYLQKSYCVKEFSYNIKKCSFYLKKKPGIRLIVLDSANTFFL